MPRVANERFAVVREALQAYADRGVFRGFSEIRNGQFTFVWLAPDPMKLSVDPTTDVLRFKQLLPGIPARSSLYAALKGFISGRHDSGLPEHRRIDRKRAEVFCSNRNGFVSVQLKVKKGEYAYGVNRIVNLVHELFLHLRDAHPDYLAENFNARQE
jgi:hypothetical protein